MDRVLVNVSNSPHSIDSIAKDFRAILAGELPVWESPPTAHSFPLSVSLLGLPTSTSKERIQIQMHKSTEIHGTLKHYYITIDEAVDDAA